MEPHIKIIKSLLREGYKLKSQHFNPKWKQALEDGEDYIKSQKQ